MPLIYNGKTLNDNDIQAIREMLRDSLKNHLDYYRHEYLEEDDEFTTSSRLLSSVFDNALKSLDSQIDTAHKPCILGNVTTYLRITILCTGLKSGILPISILMDKI